MDGATKEAILLYPWFGFAIRGPPWAQAGSVGRDPSGGILTAILTCDNDYDYDYEHDCEHEHEHDYGLFLFSLGKSFVFFAHTP